MKHDPQVMAVAKRIVAYHEAGHAVANVLAFRHCALLPAPLPRAIIKDIAIFTEGTHLSGLCNGPGIYSTKWPERRIQEAFRDAMEWHIVTMMAGGVAETIHRGRKGKRDLLANAFFQEGADGDLDEINLVMQDLEILDGKKPSNAFWQRLAVRTRDCLLVHWLAVDALAQALVKAEYLPGREAESIIDTALPS